MICKISYIWRISPDITMIELPIEILAEIASWLDQRSAIVMSRVCRKFHNIVWSTVVQRSIRFTFPHLSPSRKIQEYIFRDMVMELQDARPETWAWGMYTAAQQGKIDCVNKMVEKGSTDWNWVLRGACFSGNQILIQRSIDHGANNWNAAAQTAAEGGQKEILDDMLSRGAQAHLALWGICAGGHIDYLEDMLSLVSPKDHVYAIGGAASGGNLAILNMLVEFLYGSWSDNVIHWAFHAAIGRRQYDVINYLTEKFDLNWDWALHSACSAGYLDLIKFAIDHGANNWNWGMSGACNGGHRTIVDFMISNGANDWDGALKAACKGNQYFLFPFLYIKGAEQCYCCNQHIIVHPGVL
jgi:hypothetical protein